MKVEGPTGEIPGYLVVDKTWWLARPSLAPGASYHVSAKLVAPNHRPKLHEWTFSTTPVLGGLGGRVTPGDNETVGVGAPITLRFANPVVNRAQVEGRLDVTTSVPVNGAWHWMNDHEVHWRPETYWPAHTEVWFDANLQGVDAGNGVFGDVHRTAHFFIGDSHVSIADANAHTLTVYHNGAVVKSFPMSAGREQYPTMSGKHLVLGKAADVVMDSRTNGIPLSDPDGYLEHVAWDTQISTTGEYVHAAPWSTRQQGRDNVSHGCINLSDANAQWFYNWSLKGDIVEVVGTPRPPNSDAAMVDWVLPFDQWQQGSALYEVPTAQPRVRVW